jgi:hypothetical protein
MILKSKLRSLLQETLSMTFFSFEKYELRSIAFPLVALWNVCQGLFSFRIHDYEFIVSLYNHEIKLEEV